MVKDADRARFQDIADFLKAIATGIAEGSRTLEEVQAAYGSRFGMLVMKEGEVSATFEISSMSVRTGIEGPGLGVRTVQPLATFLPFPLPIPTFGGGPAQSQFAGLVTGTQQAVSHGTVSLKLVRITSTLDETKPGEGTLTETGGTSRPGDKGTSVPANSGDLFPGRGRIITEPPPDEDDPAAVKVPPSEETGGGGAKIPVSGERGTVTGRNRDLEIRPGAVMVITGTTPAPATPPPATPQPATPQPATPPPATPQPVKPEPPAPQPPTPKPGEPQPEPPPAPPSPATPPASTPGRSATPPRRGQPPPGRGAPPRREMRRQPSREQPSSEETLPLEMRDAAAVALGNALMALGAQLPFIAASNQQKQIIAVELERVARLLEQGQVEAATEAFAGVAQRYGTYFGG